MQWLTQAFMTSLLTQSTLRPKDSLSPALVQPHILPTLFSCLIFASGVHRQQDFMQWLTQTLIASLYPGAPYERKYLAVLLLGTLLEVWNSPDAGCKSFISLQGGEGSLPASNDGLLVVGQHSFKAFCDGFFEAKTTRLLLGEHHCISVCALCGGVRCKP